MFLKLLMRNFQMVYRTLKSVALRPFVLLKYKISSFTNISKLLNKIPKFFASLLAKLKVKPEKREDYVDAGPIFIAKSLLVIIVLGLIAAPLLIYYFAWPWFVGMFLTAKLYAGQPQLEKYNGKVEIYYEKKLENMMFKGRMKEGKYAEQGEEFFQNGMPKYAGSYLEGKYEGIGTLYSEDGKQLYKGSFKAGLYDGTGQLLLEDGSIYNGDFTAGVRTGKGQILKDDKLIYEGEVKDDKKSGTGKLYYPDGSVSYAGAFAEDVFEGEGMEYFKGGRIKYKGAFKKGMYADKGVLYDEQGAVVYEGGFEEGLFSGEGRYYGKDGELLYAGTFVKGLYDGSGKLIFVKDSMWYEGPFLAGKASGDGKLYKNGTLYYEGGFADDMMSGNGTLTDSTSGVTYTGLFENNDIAYGKLFSAPIEDIYGAFSKGLQEDSSGAHSFFLYNKTFGAVLKFSYATESEPAKLTGAYTVTKKEAAGKISSVEDLKLPGEYKAGKAGEGTVDMDAALLLGVEPADMKYYKAEYEGYGVCFWTFADTGEIAAIEYYPIEEQQPEGAAMEGKAEPGNGKPGEADGEKYAAHFSELGLDIKDFASLGF